MQQRLEEPETNGVVERWNRTFKEQAIYGRVFHNLAELRAAVAAFVERYNQCWRLEKLSYRTPLEARESASTPISMGIIYLTTTTRHANQPATGAQLWLTFNGDRRWLGNLHKGRIPPNGVAA